MTNTHQKITINPNIMMGKPIIAGTRITVELILRQLAQGIAIEKILQNYPHLNRDDIYAAINYAANLTEQEHIYPLNPLPHAHQTKAFA